MTPSWVGGKEAARACTAVLTMVKTKHPNPNVEITNRLNVSFQEAMYPALSVHHSTLQLQVWNLTKLAIKYLRWVIKMLLCKSFRWSIIAAFRGTSTTLAPIILMWDYDSYFMISVYFHIQWRHNMLIVFHPGGLRKVTQVARTKAHQWSSELRQGMIRTPPRHLRLHL